MNRTRRMNPIGERTVWALQRFRQSGNTRATAAMAVAVDGVLLCAHHPAARAAAQLVPGVRARSIQTPGDLFALRRDTTVFIDGSLALELAAHAFAMEGKLREAERRADDLKAQLDRTTLDRKRLATLERWWHGGHVGRCLLWRYHSFARGRRMRRAA